MNITQIRNATQRITFGGKTFLVDPMLAKKGAYPALPERARRDPQPDRGIACRYRHAAQR